MSYFGPGSTSAYAGLSHSIGKRIGATYGVPHGVTSCILLPHVIRYKATQPEDAARLAPVNRILDPASCSLSDREAALNLALSVSDLVHRLDLPTRLREFNIPEHALEDIAAASASDPAGQAVVMEILKQAWYFFQGKRACIIQRKLQWRFSAFIT